MKTGPIAFFDSGVGGLTVLRAALRILPQENFLYFADNKQVPYGDLSTDAIFRSTLAAMKFLVEMGAKAIVIACHTASVTCLPALQSQIPVPVIGVVEGSMHAVQGLKAGSSIALLGTTRTIQSGVYQALLQARGFRVLPVACPSLVQIIEQGIFEGPMLEEKVRHDMAALQGEKIDAVFFACTHYPLIQPVIQRVLGSHIIYLDGTFHTALRLSQMPFFNKKPSLQVYLTGRSEVFLRTVESVLQRPVQYHVVNIGEPAILPARM